MDSYFYSCSKLYLLDTNDMLNMTNKYSTFNNQKNDNSSSHYSLPLYISKSKHQNSSNQINILPNLLPCIHLLCAQYRVSVVWGSQFRTIQHQHHCTAATKTSKYKLKENLNQCRGTNKINQIKIFFKYWNTNWSSIDSKNDLVCLKCGYILYCIICQLQLGIFRVDANICSD